MEKRLESLPENELLRLRKSAETFGEGSLEAFDSIPDLPTAEVMYLAFGEPYWFLKSRAIDELYNRLSIVDSIVFAHREQQAQQPES